jgi:serine/threonine-protein kinase
MSPSGRPAAPDIGVGTVVDRYEIVRHVASGGMGSVWLARFGGGHGFTKQVALKTILPERADNAESRTMFLEEARISSKLAHPNVAQVLDVGTYHGAVYIVFEWVDGESLEHLCRTAEAREQTVPTPFLLRALIDACEGLHAAHELRDDQGTPLGVVHRDVTPGNILVSEKGFAKVIDFGIAKARDRVSGETKSGLVKGTPQYMAPEAACRSAVDRRADVWSLGAVLYRALAGEAPFAHLDALLEYIEGAEPLRPLPAHVPEEVRAIVLRALAVDPARRFATAEEMRKALERALHAVPESPEEASRAASLLAATPVTVRDVPPGAALSPKAASVRAPAGVEEAPARVHRAAAAANPTLLSPVHESVVRPRRRGDPVKAMTLVVVVSAIVTVVAVLLVYCG